MKIPLVDLVAQYHSIKNEIDSAVMEVLANGTFILGPNVTAFEHEVAEYLGVKHAVGLASGTDALVIALRSAGIGRGDEVIVPTYTFFATIGAVMNVGAKPVFVDVFSDNYLIDHTQIEQVITPQTKALIPVHLYGMPADMEKIMMLADQHDLIVIEDNAQALGAEFNGRKTGSIGQIGCLSFFPSKILGAYGDGGMLVTNDKKLNEQARALRTHGWKKKYFTETLGYNSRLDELQAAILRVKLSHLDYWIKRRCSIADIYSRSFEPFALRSPKEVGDHKHVYHLYVVASDQRKMIQHNLKENGIDSAVYYPQPAHLTSICRDLGYQRGDFPISEKASKETLAIPIYPEMTRKQIDKIVGVMSNMF